MWSVAASPPGPEHMYAKAQTNRTPYEFDRIPCRQGMASALRKHVCGGSRLKSMEFLAEGAWPALSEDTSVEAPTNIFLHEIY